MKKIKNLVKKIKKAYKANDYRRGEIVGIIKGGLAAVGGFVIGTLIKNHKNK